MQRAGAQRGVVTTGRSLLDSWSTESRKCEACFEVKRQRQMKTLRGSSAAWSGAGDERSVCNEQAEEFDSLNFLS